MAKAFGDKVLQTTGFTSYSLKADKRKGVPSVTGRPSATLMAWREHKYNDPILHWTCVLNDGSKGMGFSVTADGSMTDWGDDNYFWRMAEIQFKINGSLVAEMNFNGRKQMPNFKNQQTYHMSPDGSESGSCFDHPLSEENLDTGLTGDGSYASFGQKGFTSSFFAGFQVEDAGLFKPGNWYASGTVATNMTFRYPLYIPIGGGNDNYLPGTGSSTSLTASRTYRITKAGYSNTIKWSPSNSTGQNGLGITTEVTVNGRTTNQSGNSSYTFNSPNSTGYSYSGYVKRYYSDCSDLSATSNTVYFYTYSKPTLTGITLSKYIISPRSGASIRVNLSGINNKTHNFENTFRTGIWSNIKGKYYIDSESANSYRDLSAENLKTMFPDTSASDGAVSGTIYANRRNLGISGGNPGSGRLIYETASYSKGIKIQYTPTESIDPNREPNPGDDGASGICYYKNENNTQGAKLTAGYTWELLNNYDISNMTGVNVKVQYPKTDGSGVISGYRVRLYSAVDGSPKSDTKYYENHFNTSDYIFTFTIFYSELRRGVSGNIIKITPYYTASNGAKWYGPEVSKRFVDIVWRLNKPVIDCPLNDTTWHNHKYRILFRLPIDKDTQYNGNTNDIENYYGSGNYRYQNICIKINGTDTYFDDKTFYNAHNAWNSPISISNANLTYRRTIIVNPSLLPNYKDEASYSIQIRVRKAYGQNSNCDGWSDWSDTVFVRRKTVSNDVVKRHEYIMASHYKTVQDAFNNSLACYSKTASDNKNFVVKESFDRIRGDNINGPHLSPPTNTPLRTIREYVSEFNDLHQLKNKINSYASFDTDQDRSLVKLDSKDNLLANFTPSQEFITAAKDQNGATECDNINTILKGRNYMKYMCDELNHLY